ncbi:uncharacterized protein MYCFIDRAFT_200660 [Pseudocercospora fijiensis CIRAD86]|uniref:Uncharacterized protein n=1 Tax=Pseudocercospora fijiensis (strain CIRAD86) TaxID=383855 RepID=M2ZE21_PSEFD|nr:uncharacterized protein MYCFIDRAFT_200660 [Pseudocercospora fijiensis CIRAD86]EME77374.1 hypothetical protein MYCFIDRAFT_200660 [Pseudocercospora fijiensis CIRAD86]
MPPRRNSYVCLPDDPIGGMPRSRTFSNLPLPSKIKKTTNALVQSKSHARLPSVSRIPTPTASNRKYSTSRLPSLDLRHAPARSKLIRSDTEPLLQHVLEQGTNIPRSTAFKENISLSPIKPLPSMLADDDRFGFVNSPRRSGLSRGWSDSSDVGEPLLPQRKSSLPASQRASLRAHPARLSQKFDSSPAYRPSRERPPTPGQPGQPVQRWNSQPILTNNTNFRSSHGEIKQTRLMSERGPPTPPLVSTSLSRELSGNDLKRMSITSNHLQQVTELPTLNIDQTLDSTSNRPRANSLQPRPGAINTAQPFAYWTGRFSSLNDRYRNEDLAASFLPSHHTSPAESPCQWHTKSETDKMHTTEANTKRMRRAVEHLYSLCATDQAKESFLKWQKAVAIALATPELARPVNGSDGTRRGWNLEMSLRSSSMANLTGSHASGGENRKFTSFVDRLLGRRQKSEALLATG